MPRPKYEPSEEHFQTAYIGAKKGLSEAAIATAIGVSYRTFRKYKKEFAPHIKKGRGESDDVNCELVESAMLKSCLGWEYDEVKTVTKQTYNSATGEAIEGLVDVQKTTITKQVLPNPTLIMFYSVNRSKRWHSINHETKGGSGTPIPVVSHLLPPPEEKKDNSNGTKKNSGKKAGKKLQKGVPGLPRKTGTGKKQKQKKPGKKKTKLKKR